MITIFTSPFETFERLKQKGGWLVPFLVLMFFYVVVAWLQMPAVIALAQKTADRMSNLMGPLGQNNPGLAVQKSAIFIEINTYFGALAGPAIAMFLGGLLLLLLKAIVSGQGTYMQLSKVALFSMFPAIIGGLLSGLLVRLGAVSDVKSAKISLASLLPEPKGALYALLTMFDPFWIWGLILTIIGATVMTQRPLRQVALWITIPVVVLNFLIVWVTSLVS